MTRIMRIMIIIRVVLWAYLNVNVNFAEESRIGSVIGKLSLAI